MPRFFYDKIIAQQRIVRNARRHTSMGMPSFFLVFEKRETFNEFI